MWLSDCVLGYAVAAQLLLPKMLLCCGMRDGDFDLFVLLQGPLFEHISLLQAVQVEHVLGICMVGWCGISF